LVPNLAFAQDEKTIDTIKEDLAVQTNKEKLMHDYFNLARLYVMSDFDSAAVYYNKALLLANNQNDQKFTAEIYLGISKLEAKRSEFEKSAKNCELALQLANEIEDDSLIIVANLLSTKIKVIKSDFSNVLAILDPALEKAQQLGDSLLISECYDAYATYYYYTDVAKSVEYYIKSLRIIEKYKATESLLSRIVNIGSLYGRIGQNDKAIEYLLRGAEIAETTDQEYVKSTIYNNLAVIYFNQGDNEKSKQYLEKALIIAHKLKDEPMVCGIVVNLGEIYQGDKQYDKAMEYYKAGLENPAIENLPEQKIYTLHNIASLHFDLKEYRTAIKYSEDALAIAKELNITIHNVELYKVLAESYEKVHDYKAALKSQKFYKMYNDSLFNIQSTEKITEIQSKYDFDTSEKENLLLKKDNKIQALTITKQKNQQLLLLILLILILMSIVLVYLRMKKDRKMNVLLSAKNKEINQKSNELEKANKAKDKFFTILAHDLRNPFNSILGSLEILHNEYDSLNDDDRRQFIDLIYKSADSTNKLLANLLEWSMVQRGRISLKKKNNDLSSLINESVNLHLNLALKKEIEIQNQIHQQLIAFFDKKTISVTINNLINNAIKFTPKKGKVLISANKVNGFVQVSIKDTGIGMPSYILNSLFKIESTQSTPGTDSEPGTGLGLILCKEFIEKNNGQINVSSEEGKGSCFEISLPVEG
jgi:signal transduction histidine kinase